jgi:hypothetical protein
VPDTARIDTHDVEPRALAGNTSPASFITKVTLELPGPPGCANNVPMRCVGSVARNRTNASEIDGPLGRS